MIIDLALFDLDDTLLDHRGASRAGLIRRLAEIGIAEDGDAAFARWHALEEEHYPRYLRGEIGHEEQRRTRVRGFLAPHGVLLEQDAEADAWWAGFAAWAHAAWTRFDDVDDCLAALGDRPVGIITNGVEIAQRAKLTALGLEGRVDPVVCSGAVGIAKPDPRIFRLACEAAGIPPERACYVGDRLRTDAIGAAEAGLLGVWLDRDGGATDEELATAHAAGVHVIRTLAELPAILTE